jgi:photosystem II stability/assembly factor-like uncharacterized protein
MSLPSSPVSQAGPAERDRGSSSSWRWKVVFLCGLLALVAALVWQVANRQQNGMIAGRPLSSPQTHLHTVVISPRPGVVYLGTHYGLFTSTDGGRTWPESQGALNTNMITSIAVSPSNPNLLAVLAVPTSGLSGRMGIYVSADAGQHWRFTLPAHLAASAFPYSIQAAPGGRGHFYAFFTYAGWFETQDLGQHWSAITAGSLASIQTPSLLIDPSNPAHLLMGGDQGLFETRDDGRNWQKVAAVQGYVSALAATVPRTGQPRVIFCATDQGLYRWQEGQEIAQVGHLPAPDPPLRLAVSADGSALYALFRSDLWFSPDLGATWTRREHFPRGDMVALALDPANPEHLLAGFYSPGLVMSSSDGAVSWRVLTD